MPHSEHLNICSVTFQPDKYVKERIVKLIANLQRLFLKFYTANMKWFLVVYNTFHKKFSEKCFCLYIIYKV